ncbi:uncharacterized protein UV8b_01478 [Ustilaginoidea virens]|uniref:Uncharacterized protein n=1 Tax=Ustilaginoidea virens TaxID=1159556 RepID=A0A1B5KZR4_USTVR|nr:uncharacterized protein UV8b_01478 [Ustilaginoidea virens]QUC17237.1 hypothetical protein UV8b_01478 [Ustilaginoidea virens]GAO16613.1 hypothetical protein UVI_02019490 [Ustilaginoidea virens]
MKVDGKTLLVAASLFIGLGAAAAAASASEAEVFLAENPHVQVGREALAEAEASAGPNTFSVVNKPAGNVVMVQEYDADTHKLVYAVALVDDAKAEQYYKKHNKGGDVKGKVMKRYGSSAERCGRSEAADEPRVIFERASRCGQFCSRSPSCTAQRRCPSCRYVGGNCRHQLSCQPRNV